MTKCKSFVSAITFASVMAMTSAASATVFTNEYNGVVSSYDDTNDVYAMTFRSDLGNDGFSLIVTDGTRPAGTAGTYAILYGDLANNRITAYSYEGGASSDAHTRGTLLGTFENAFSDAGPHSTLGYDQLAFNLDVSDINSALGGGWRGVVSGDKSGIWFHESQGSSFTYGADGSIVDYTFTSRTFLDRDYVTSGTNGPSVNCATTPDPIYCNPTLANPPGISSSGGFVDGGSSSSSSGGGSTSSSGGGTSSGGSVPSSSGGGSVPAPGGLAILLVGLAGLTRMRRREKV